MPLGEKSASSHGSGGRHRMTLQGAACRGGRDGLYALVIIEVESTSTSTNWTFWWWCRDASEHCWILSSGDTGSGATTIEQASFYRPQGEGVGHLRERAERKETDTPARIHSSRH
eukprot:EG_transcript_35750